MIGNKCREGFHIKCAGLIKVRSYKFSSCNCTCHRSSLRGSMVPPNVVSPMVSITDLEFDSPVPDQELYALADEDQGLTDGPIEQDSGYCALCDFSEHMCYHCGSYIQHDARFCNDCRNELIYD